MWQQVLNKKGRCTTLWALQYRSPAEVETQAVTLGSGWWREAGAHLTPPGSGSIGKPKTIFIGCIATCFQVSTCVVFVSCV